MSELKLGDLTVPRASRRLFCSRIHEQLRVDPYKHLETLDGATLKYITEENQYAGSVLSGVRGLQSALYDEMVSRLDQSMVWPLAVSDEYEYFSKTQQGLGYKVYFRKSLSTGEEQVLLDLNVEAKPHAFFKLGCFKISPDQQRIAYTADVTGAEIYHLHIRDINTGIILDEVLVEVDAEIVWDNDNQTIFYLTLDDTMRPHRAYRHKVGSNSQADDLLYQEEDQQYHLSLSRSFSRKYIFITSASSITTEVRCIAAGSPQAQPTVLAPRQRDVRYYPDHRDNKFFFLTNFEAESFRIVAVSHDMASDKTNWEDVIPHHDSVLIESFDLFEDCVVSWEVVEGAVQIRVRELNDQQEEYLVPLPEQLCFAEGTEDYGFNSRNLRVNYSSPVTPSTVFDWEFGSKNLKILKTKEISHYEPENYKAERLYAVNPSDGVRIPITLLSTKNSRKGEEGPLLLYGYGAYCAMYYQSFSEFFITLLEHGMSVAIAHIRGGGECGYGWYVAGKKFNKLNTFSDFIASAEFLIGEGYTSRGKLAIWGRSAGGLLIGAVLNMRPDLFKVALTDVPFVDVVNTMLNPDLPLTEIEYDEWGNPNIKDDYDYMMKYSPYDNVVAQMYPALFIMAGLNDSRVRYHEPLKWVAKLRQFKTDDHPLLLQIKEQGHSVSDSKYEKFKEWAARFAFVLAALND